MRSLRCDICGGQEDVKPAVSDENPSKQGLVCRPCRNRLLGEKDD